MASSTSFSNTPQATDDSYSTSENLLENGQVLFFDVMNNDLGGKAKTLFSVDNEEAIKELSQRDTAGVWEKTEDGNWITIGKDPVTGTTGILYKLSEANKSAINSLAEGQVSTDSFAYTIRMANGTLSVATVTVTITGSNDGPVITSLDQTGDVIEAGNEDDGDVVDGTVTAKGKVTAIDVDNGAVLTYSGDTDSTYGSFTVDAQTGDWTYTLDNNAADSLAEGDSEEEEFTVTVTDDKGATTTQIVTITITGTNDAPVIVAGGVVEGTVVESGEKDGEPVAGVLTATGNVAADDVDNGAVLTYSTEDKGTLGTFEIDSETGEWTYTLSQEAADSLAEGDSEEEEFTVTVTDDKGATTTQVVTITITGTNDSPTVVGVLNVTNKEGDASFTLNLLNGASDEDIGETEILVVSDVRYTFNGEATALPAGVSLTDAMLTVDPTNAVFNSLAVGQRSVIVVSYNVEDAQGATVPQTATIIIEGTNDAPTISAAIAVTVTEDQAPSTVNALENASDVDNGDNAKLVVTNIQANLPAGVTFNAANNQFTLDPSHPAYQTLNAGQSTTVTVNYSVSDGIASTPTSITWTVLGADEVVQTPVRVAAAPTVFTGTGDTNDKDNEVQADNTANNLSGTGNNNDTLRGSTQNDTLDGANGNDIIYGGAGDDFIQGGKDNDTIFSGSGTDTVYGDNQNGEVAGTDEIYGGSGNDTIFGGASSDLIVGGFGADHLTGNGGNDSFKYLDIRDTGDTITDFARGQDRIDFSALNTTRTFSFSTEGLQAYGVYTFYENGNTIVQLDSDGVATTAELEIKLSGQIPLTESDFML